MADQWSFSDSSSEETSEETGGVYMVNTAINAVTGQYSSTPSVYFASSSDEKSEDEKSEDECERSNITGRHSEMKNAYGYALHQVMNYPLIQRTRESAIALKYYARLKERNYDQYHKLKGPEKPSRFISWFMDLLYSDIEGGALITRIITSHQRVTIEPRTACHVQTNIVLVNPLSIVPRENGEPAGTEGLGGFDWDIHSQHYLNLPVQLKVR